MWRKMPLGSWFVLRILPTTLRWCAVAMCFVRTAMSFLRAILCIGWIKATIWSHTDLWCAKIRSERPKSAQVPVEYGVADVHAAVPFLSCCPGGRKSVSPKTAGLVPGTQNEATPDNGLHSSRDDRAR